MMKSGKKKKFMQGDQIHIVVTSDFAHTANQFYDICKRNHYNALEVIRSSIESWIAEQKYRLELYENIKNKKHEYS